MNIHISKETSRINSSIESSLGFVDDFVLSTDPEDTNFVQTFIGERNEELGISIR